LSIADQALTDEKEARSAVEDSTGDAKGAANSAIARSVALSWSAQFSPLSLNASTAAFRRTLPSASETIWRRSAACSTLR
jgi:hypothetical protein